MLSPWVDGAGNLWIPGFEYSASGTSSGPSLVSGALWEYASGNWTGPTIATAYGTNPGNDIGLIAVISGNYYGAGITDSTISDLSNSTSTQHEAVYWNGSLSSAPSFITVTAGSTTYGPYCADGGGIATDSSENVYLGGTLTNGTPIYDSNNAATNGLPFIFTNGTGKKLPLYSGDTYGAVLGVCTGS
jgi:hypothetical protein